MFKYVRIKPCHNIYLTCANEFIAPHRIVLLLSTFVLQFIDPADFSPEAGGTKTQPTITETLPAKVKVPEYRKETSKEAVKKKQMMLQLKTRGLNGFPWSGKRTNRP